MVTMIWAEISGGVMTAATMRITTVAWRRYWRISAAFTYAETAPAPKPLVIDRLSL